MKIELAAESEPNKVPPLTVKPVVVALEKETFKADKEPRDEPPETVSPVVVAFPKLVLPKTFNAPSWAPPVTPSDVEVAVPNQAAELTVKAVVEALVICPVVDQKFVAVRLVVEALVKLKLPETVKAPPTYVLP